LTADPFLDEVRFFSQRIYGALLLVFGLIAIVPLSVQAGGDFNPGPHRASRRAARDYQGQRKQSSPSTWAPYLTGVLMILGGLLLSPGRSW
jgi:hypothetical protein